MDFFFKVGLNFVELQLPTGQIKMQLLLGYDNYNHDYELQLPTGQIKMQPLITAATLDKLLEKVATPHGSDKNATPIHQWFESYGTYCCNSPRVR